MTPAEAINLVEVFDAPVGSTCGHTGCEDHPKTEPVVRVGMSYTFADWPYDDFVEILAKSDSIELINHFGSPAIRFICHELEYYAGAKTGDEQCE